MTVITEKRTTEPTSRKTARRAREVEGARVKDVWRRIGKEGELKLARTDPYVQP